MRKKQTHKSFLQAAITTHIVTSRPMSSFCVQLVSCFLLVFHFHIVLFCMCYLVLLPVFWCSRLMSFTCSPALVSPVPCLLVNSCIQYLCFLCLLSGHCTVYGIPCESVCQLPQWSRCLPTVFKTPFVGYGLIKGPMA